MFPVYKYLDSYPQSTHQMNHPPQYPHLYPGWEGVPPYAKLKSPIPPVNYEPWPYPNSTECHGCCSHGYPSGFYNYRPPHPHLPPHPPIYFHGAYPPYPDSHPAYFIPPSPYSTGQPQYEYDKNIPRYHYCGCSNHSHFPKNESSVKIEEQKPEIENKKDDLSDPINFLNYPYPVVWFPPGYTKDRESSVKIEEHEHKPEKDNKKDDSSSSINFPSYPNPAVWFPPGFKNGEINKQTEAEPKFQNGWVPLEMHGNRLLKNGGEEKKNQQNGEEKKTQFPLPIIWMPGYDRPEEAQKNDLKEIDVDSGAAKDPPKLKIIPLKRLEKDNHEDKQGEVKVPGNEEKIEAAAPQNKENLVVAEKERKIRSIPVKQIEEIEKRTDENGTKKPSLPVKTSKLPPVCLRVDPMPGKKTKVSKSRSPSPPGEKERSPRQAHVVDSKLPKQVAEDSEGFRKRDTKVVEVDKKTTNTRKEDREDESAAKVLVQIPVGSTKDVSEKTVEERENQIPVIPSKDISGKTATEEEDKGVTAKEDHGVAEAAKGQGEEVKKKSFTIEEAAVLIQSAYHGFEVRRFEPLKKLKQIARVRDQAHDIRERICSLEASAVHRKDEKQILVISEAIMGLLLQLDTIQGLHPLVREVRKAVARELVCLQEKLDSLSGLPDETKSTVVEDLTNNSAEDGNQTARDCSSVPEGLSHKTEELAEPPLVREEKLDSKVEVFAELPMLEDGKSHSSSEESAEYSVVNAETSDPPKLEESVSSLVKVEVPLLEDEKMEPELEELSLPSFVKTESEFEPMEKVDQDSKLDDFLHPTLVKDGIVEKPELQPGESVEAKSKAEESMVELANSLVKDEEPKSKMVESIELTLLEDEKAEPNFVELSPPSSVKAETEFEPVEEVETEPKSDELLQTLKDEILEETESQPEEFGEPKSKKEESMEPESELEQPLLGRGVNSGEPEPNHESEMGGGTISGSLISVAVGEQIETGSNTESMNAIVGGEETETKETVETEPGKSTTDGFMEEIESVLTKAANEPNVLENVSTQSILENGSTESKFASEYTAQTNEEILPPLVEVTEGAENRSLIEVESTLVDGEAVSENTHENRGIDLEVAEELGSTEAIEEGDLEEKKKWAGKLEEQNEKLRDMVEMLLEAGKKQLNVITDLGDRVRDLEKKLSKKKQKGRRQKMKGSSCSRVGNNLVRESSGSTALC